MMFTKNYCNQTVDVFQASLLNLIKGAPDNGIHNLFHDRSTEFYRFIICKYIHSLTPCHPLRGELQEHTLNDTQTLTFYENNSIKEEKLKNEWIALLNSSASKAALPSEKTTSDNNNDDEEHHTISAKNGTEKKKEEPIDYKSIGKNCWIYIVQNYLTQKDKLFILPYLNRFFYELSSDGLVWREISLTSYEINTNIPYYSSSFELFLSNKCTKLESIDFECLAKDKISWNIIWKVISQYCLTLKNIHIGLYDGVWKFEFNQLSPICNELLYNIEKHVINTDSDCNAMYLPIQRIECAPGVMPNHIVSLLNYAQCLEHFFVPLIYNDSDDRWDSASFWNIPSSLPSTLKSFRGFDAQTPLRFVHECIIHLPNIEEFHVVLYFGSAHPDFIACSYTSDTLKHLASYCKRLTSFEGYFDSCVGILDGVELMIESCCNLKLVGLLFHPDVGDGDIDALINGISQSVVCCKYSPQFERLTEMPNQHVTLRVVEIHFEHCDVSVELSQRTEIIEDEEINGTKENISSQHLKSLDEIDFSDQNEDDYLMMNNDDLSEIGLDEKPLKRNSNNHNHNHNNLEMSDSNDSSNI